MARRRGWKSGEWLVEDQESGFTEYASKMAYDYYGVLKKKSQRDRIHPQDFVRAKNDPFPVDPQNPPVRTYNTSAYNLGLFVGNTSVLAPTGPASHLYNQATGIGSYIIESTFEVK